VEETKRRTPDLSLRDTFLKAANGLRRVDGRAAVVGDALEYLQRGFDAHYAGGGTGDEDILVGDNAYALAVETIARLDEPRFVAVAGRMIRDGAGRIAGGGAVSLEMWTPHLGGLLDIISEEGAEASEARIRAAARELRGQG
jgi:hypothetical protein